MMFFNCFEVIITSGQPQKTGTAGPIIITVISKKLSAYPENSRIPNENGLDTF
jgi:hypothetical protein